MKRTRREVVKLGGAAGASLLLGGGSLSAQSARLIGRTIPSSGETVPVIGLGARNYRVGDDQAQRAPFKATLKAFADGGGKLVDTAPGYGNSETVVGGSGGGTGDLRSAVCGHQGGSRRPGGGP